MSTTENTPEGQPLDPHTLRVVLDKLKALHEFVTPAHQGAAEWHSRWHTGRLTGVSTAVAYVAEMIDEADPRARVVVLPEPFPYTGDRVTDWPCGVWSVDAEVYVSSGYITAETGPTMAGSILAAIEFAGGAK